MDGRELKEVSASLSEADKLLRAIKTEIHYPNNEIRQCVFCGSDFRIGAQLHMKFCSRGCRSNYYTCRSTMCVICKIEFYRVPWAHRAVTCSEKCWIEHEKIKKLRYKKNRAEAIRQPEYAEKLRNKRHDAYPRYKERMLKYHREYWLRTKEDRLAYDRQYYAQHREKAIERRNRYAANNKDKMREARMERYYNNPEEYRRRSREWYVNNEEKRKQTRQNRRAAADPRQCMICGKIYHSTNRLRKTCSSFCSKKWVNGSERKRLAKKAW